MMIYICINLQYKKSLAFKISVSCLKQILSKSLVDIPKCFIYIYTIEIQLYFNILKVYTCMTELIFNIKCSCLDVQILKEKVEFWRGGHNFGSNNKGWATKIKPLFLGGARK